MKSKNALLALVVFVLGSLVTTSAFADRRHHHRHHHSGVRLGVFVGPGFFYDPPYYPYYRYPRVVVAPPPAPVYYIERPAEQTAPSLPAGYWYYCNESRAYYPYVRECPGSWQQVAPAPQPSN